MQVQISWILYIIKRDRFLIKINCEILLGIKNWIWKALWMLCNTNVIKDYLKMIGSDNSWVWWKYLSKHSKTIYQNCLTSRGQKRWKLQQFPFSQSDIKNNKIQDVTAKLSHAKNNQSKPHIPRKNDSIKLRNKICILWRHVSATNFQEVFIITAATGEHITNII